MVKAKRTSEFGRKLAWYFDAASKDILTMPASPAGVSADWLQQALAPTIPGVAVKAVTAERLGEGYGLTSHIFRYRWQTGEPPQIVSADMRCPVLLPAAFLPTG